MSHRNNIIERGKVKDIDLDAGVRNPWKWSWLEKQVDGNLLSTCIYKIKEAGLFSSGTKSGELSEPYGIHPSLKEKLSATGSNDVTDAPKVLVPVSDRVVNMEAAILGFIAENNLHFSVTTDLIDLAKKLSQDHKALNELSMDRTTASYKMTFGVGKTFMMNLTEVLRNTKFSLNIDEATSDNFHRVLAVLVSYFCPTKREIVVNHLASLSVIKVDSATLYSELVGVMENNNLLWNNLMSILMDSCNVMRGSKSGLEVRIREGKAPHLLDIGGDSCRHVHKATKAFCKPFGYVAEALFNDLHNDLKWSADIRHFMQKICMMLGIKYTAPLRFVNHRWLSVYTVSVDTQRLMDFYTVLYAGFMSPDKKHKAFPQVQEIYKRMGVSQKSKDRLRDTHSTLGKKSLTKDGRDRKDRIIGKIFDERMLITLVLNLYSSVLPLLKKFTLLFEMKEPPVHIPHDKQLELVREFLDCFVKPEKLQNLTPSSLAKLDLNNAEMLLNPVNMFMGVKALRIVKENMKSNVTRSFLENLKSAYVASGDMLKTKLPIGNKLLQNLSAIDPSARGHTLTLQGLQNLAQEVGNVLSDDEKNECDREVRRYQRDESLPVFENIRIDTWWAKVQRGGKYPCCVSWYCPC